MFDLAWSEIALIGIVALIAIGPKDLPVAIKAVAEMVKKARRMAGEFQTHVDDMVREANLHEVRDQINELRTVDIKGKILNAVDGDGTLRQTLNENPLNPALYTPPPPVQVTPAAPDPAALDPPGAPEPQAAPPAPPAFIPPAEVQAPLPAAPAFIPPDAATDRPHPRA